jgi:TATA-box binding protein (TBP) (component of TFIID and TFIIIB)
MDVKISTITISTQLPYCNLNLTNIGKYLSIDNEIIGLKYNYAELSLTKGRYSTTIYKKAKVKDVEKINKKLFYNQVTIIYNNNGNDVNVKLFGNGSLHLTGCKTIEEGSEVTKQLYLKLKALVKEEDGIILTKDKNNVLIDKDKLIYSYNTHQIIGFCKADKYIINKKEFVIDAKTGMFISSKMETQRRKFIYNLNGEYIGFSKIELLKNRNKFYKKNTNIFFDFENNLIYHNNNIIIGKITYEYEKSLITDATTSQDILEVNYQCNPFINKDYLIDVNNSNFKDSIDVNVNCINVYFNIGYTINRQRFYEYLIDSNFICKYKPESYSGIKFIYKTPIQSLIKDHLELNKEDCGSDTSVRQGTLQMSDTSVRQGTLQMSDTSVRQGICTCSSKCTCSNITFLIFQSGNVIATGFKTIEQIKNTTFDFYNICNNAKHIIQKRTFT